MISSGVCGEAEQGTQKTSLGVVVTEHGVHGWFGVEVGVVPIEGSDAQE